MNNQQLTFDGAGNLKPVPSKLTESRENWGATDTQLDLDTYQIEHPPCFPNATYHPDGCIPNEEVTQ